MELIICHQSESRPCYGNIMRRKMQTWALPWKEKGRYYKILVKGWDCVPKRAGDRR